MTSNDDKILTTARATLTAFLRDKKMRRTPERYAILEKVFSTDAHFYVDMLHEAMEMEGYHVSLSTVYATIQLFNEAGLVRRHQFGNQPAQYERVVQDDHENHLHLVCSSCGRVRAMKDADLIDRINSLRYPTFRTEYFSLYLYGICSRCQKRLRARKNGEPQSPKGA